MCIAEQDQRPTRVEISFGMHHGQPCSRYPACYSVAAADWDPTAAADLASSSFADRGTCFAAAAGSGSSSFVARVRRALVAGSLESQVAIARTARVVVGDTVAGGSPAAGEDIAEAGYDRQATGLGTGAQGCRRRAGRSCPAAVDEQAPLAIRQPSSVPDIAKVGPRWTPATLRPGSGRRLSAD